MAAVQQSNVEIVQGLYEAFNEQDIDGALGPMADDIEWVEPEGFFIGGTYHSPDEVLENVFQPSLEEYDEFAVEPDQYLDAGDTVVVLGTFRATSESDERTESRFAHVYELHDGHITRFENYTDTVQWQ
jgi:ketosteroid isomerase-like protein